MNNMVHKRKQPHFTKNELAILRRSVFLHANKLDRQVDRTGKALIGKDRKVRDKLQVIGLKIREVL